VSNLKNELGEVSAQVVLAEEEIRDGVRVSLDRKIATGGLKEELKGRDQEKRGATASSVDGRDQVIPGGRNGGF